MKKFLIALCAILFLGAEVAWAQERYPVFSSALGGGGYGYGYARRGVRQSVYRPTRGAYSKGVYAGVVQKPTAPRKKTIIKYQPGQIELSEDLMEKLMPSIQRMQDGKVKSMEVIGICRNYNTTSLRQLHIGRVIHSYVPDFKIKFREISGAAVLDSNDNTMEIVEYW